LPLIAKPYRERIENNNTIGGVLSARNSVNSDNKLTENGQFFNINNNKISKNYLEMTNLFPD
jgi:hypothetical protein